MSDDDGLPGDDGHDVAALRRTHDEVRTVLEQQVQTVNDVENRSVRTVRLGLVLLGVSVSAASILPEFAGPGRMDTRFEHVGASIALLVGSVSTGAITYGLSSLTFGPAPEDVYELLREQYSETEWLVLLLRSYGVWMRRNGTVNKVNSVLLTASRTLLAGSVLLLGLDALG